MVNDDPGILIERIPDSPLPEESENPYYHNSEPWWRYIFYVIIIAGISLLTVLQFYSAVISPPMTSLSIRMRSSQPDPQDNQVPQSAQAIATSQDNAGDTLLSAPLRYIGSESCVDCHQKEYRDWMGSDHQLAMQKATMSSIGDDHFNGEMFIKDDIVTTFRRRDGKFYIDEKEKDGKKVSYQVSYVFGLHPLQQFVIPMKKGKEQLYTIAWDTEKKAWFDLYPDEKIGAHDELSWKGHQFTWNLACVECHTTNLEKHYEVKSNSYQTTFSEVSVGCEACHGPGSEHVKLANVDPKLWEGDRKMGLTVILKDVPINRIQIDSCAPCHSRRQKIAEGFEPGKRFTDYYAPEFLEDDLYFADGQIKDEVFVYGSFLQSRMFRENVKCSDCHNPHSGRVKLQGNALCIQCHSQTDYDTQLHYHHEAGSAGSECIECHMPERTYMVVDPRRDHSMKIPRPDLSVKFGTPNACNKCHTDKDESAAWAAAEIVEWFGEERPNDANYAVAFALARKNDPAAIPLLEQLMGNETDYGPIVRGTAAQLLGRFISRPGVINILEKSLHDRKPLVRTGVVQALEMASETDRIRLVSPLLGDRSRMVRIQAARLLDSVNVKQLPDNMQSKWVDAIHEYENSLLINADSPDAQLNLGVHYTNRDDNDGAVSAYNHALRIDPDYVPALVNLAMLQYQMGNRDLTETLLRKAISVRPDYADGRFMLGILLAENPQHIDEAIESLAAAVDLDPSRADIHYNLGLVYLSTGQSEAGINQLREALQQQEYAAQYRYTLIKVFINQGNWDEAKSLADEGKRLNPNDPVWDQIIDYINTNR